jgi:ABC-type branched-subunit amino acid transport system substrate-binding protein
MLAFQAAPLNEQLQAAGVDTNILLADAFEATGGYVTEGTDGFFATTHVFSEPGSRVERLDQSFAAATGAPFENPSFGALAADAILVIISAYQAAGSADGEAIGAEIANVNIDGITGQLNYGGGATPTKAVYITEMVDGAPTLAKRAG